MRKLLFGKFNLSEDNKACMYSDIAIYLICLFIGERYQLIF